MTQEVIDFTNSSKKILINPVVPLQFLTVYCRNSNRVQATLLGKIYSSSIQILEVIPVSLSEDQQIVKLDFVEHQKSLQNIMTVYPSLQIIGVAVTDLLPNRDLATLHTLYSNKESGFKPQGILVHPIILSIGTKPVTSNYDIHAYSFNRVSKTCKDILGVVAFEELQIQIHFGDADFQSMAPLFSALYDQQEIIPDLAPKEMIRALMDNLKDLKLRCQQETDNSIHIKVRRILDKLNSQQAFNMDELAYLLDYAGLQRKLSIKINKFQKE